MPPGIRPRKLSSMISYVKGMANEYPKTAICIGVCVTAVLLAAAIYFL